MKTKILKLVSVLSYLMALIFLLAVTAQGKNCDVQITKYPDNYNAFKLVNSEGIKIITDPYNMNEDIFSDIVIESHNHEDHTDVSRIKGNYTLINKTGSFDVKGVKILGVKGIHDKVNPYYQPEPNNIYIIQTDGLKFAEFGSQGQVPTTKMYEKIGKVDVLFIQVTSEAPNNFKMFVDEVGGVIKHLQPKIIIPEHGDVKSTPELSKYSGIPVKTIKSGRFTVSKSMLSSLKKPEIVVLDN